LLAAQAVAVEKAALRAVVAVVLVAIEPRLELLVVVHLPNPN
jgi:hypothetical protein